ncbi:MAG TPA: CHAD domain-containing protein [Solirubrobacteraceae bacterium]|nr:CHAD domain-containing protein [Solirubrobacteraceae bacterium]
MTAEPIELIATQPATLDSIDRALDGGFTAQRLDAWESDHILLDTFDRLLRSEGWTLAHQYGRLALSDRRMIIPVASGPPSGSPSGPLFGRDLPAGDLRQRVADAIDVRALLPLGRLHIRTEAYRITDDLQKTVVRVNVLVPQLISRGGSATPLSTRLRIQEVRGYQDERDEVIAALSPALGLGDADQTLPDEAILACGERPEGFSTKVAVPLDAGDPTGIAVSRVMRALLEVIEANLPGTLADTDSEFLHDYRVSIRRTRAVQRQFKHVFDPEELKRARAEFKWLQQSTGDARDLDVYVLGFDAMRELLPEEIRPDLEPVLTVLGRRRMVAHSAMGRALRSERARETFEAWERILGVLDHGPDADRPYSRRPIGEYTSRRIRKVYRRMLDMGRAIDAESPPEEFHDLRKKGKELRYLLELFGQPLHDSSVVKPMIKTLKSLQDVLGHHQDREVQIAMLRSLADEVAVLPGGARALMAMGMLTCRLEEDAADTRGRFGKVFEEFAAKDQRRLVKDTFS